MVALVGALGALHVAQQRVHLVQCQLAVGPHGAVAGHGRQDLVLRTLHHAAGLVLGQFGQQAVGGGQFVAGEVTVKLYKGSANVIARSSPYSLYNMDLVTFEEGAVAYDHHDAEGFIRLNGLRLKTYAARRVKLGGQA